MKELSFIGVGGATSISLGGNCCFLKDGQKLLVVDVCEDASLKLKRAGAFCGVGQVTIVLTHLHADHVAGLGVLVWYLNFELNIKPQIIIPSQSFKQALLSLFSLVGVSENLVQWVDAKNVTIDGCRISLKLTTHNPHLECYGIMFKENSGGGMVYYTGDTNDVNYVKKLLKSPKVKRVYCEVSQNEYDSHISLNSIKALPKDKLVLMHFENSHVKKEALKLGFKCAEVYKKS